MYKSQRKNTKIFKTGIKIYLVFCEVYICRILLYLNNAVTIIHIIHFLYLIENQYQYQKVTAAGLSSCFPAKCSPLTVLQYWCQVNSQVLPGGVCSLTWIRASGRLMQTASLSLMPTSGYCVCWKAFSRACSWDTVNAVRLRRCFCWFP